MPDTALSPSEEHTYVTMAVNDDGDLFVPDSHNNRLLKYESPFENDTIADQVWGQDDFTGILCNQGNLAAPTAETLCFHSYTNRLRLNRYGNGAAVDGEGSLWVADGGNNRVLRFPFDPSTGEAAKTANLVLGQPGFTTASPGTNFNRMHAPFSRRDRPATVRSTSPTRSTTESWSSSRPSYPACRPIECLGLDSIARHRW